jgi:hypothetical protein
MFVIPFAYCNLIGINSIIHILVPTRFLPRILEEQEAISCECGIKLITRVSNPVYTTFYIAKGVPDKNGHRFSLD